MSEKDFIFSDCLQLSRACRQVMGLVKKKKPLVLCLTNSVVENLTANVLLAIGARPVMLKDPQECGEMAAGADALLVNLGTLDPSQQNAILAAVQNAESQGHPWILDPVAVGILFGRTRFCQQLLADFHPSAIRGNASEIAWLAGFGSRGRGTDADAGDLQPETARLAAEKTGIPILMTGAVDWMAFPNAAGRPKLLSLENGVPLLTQVIGTGCAQGAILSACCAVASPSLALATAASWMSLAGELAEIKAAGPGSFSVSLLDALAELPEADWMERCRWRWLHD